MMEEIVKIDWLLEEVAAYELSWGIGIFHENRWGVTILTQEADGVILKSELSKGFHELEDAKKYIEKLREDFSDDKIAT